MDRMRKTLEDHIARGSMPGAVTLLARGDTVDVDAVGSMRLDHPEPMRRDTIFRIASITKPIGAAAAMILVEDGRISLDEPVARWLPEVAEARVVRTPDAAVDDVVPLARPLTLRHLLTSTSGWGFPSDFTLPAIQELFTVQIDGRRPHEFLPPDDYIAALARIPMIAQPGEKWVYAAAFDILGVLIGRITGQRLSDFLAERLFQPLGMTDTSFVLPASKRDRFAGYYLSTENGLQPGDEQRIWETTPAFESLGGGLLGTADDWLRFGRMLLSGGGTVLSPESVRLMLTNQVEARQCEGSELFLDGPGWGFGGSVDLDRSRPWNVPGRYGWVGGTGTSAHIVPATNSVAILMTQVGMASPEPYPVLEDFWTVAAEH
jgi:CubicO group peptidase (beta-lactamase class C family)